MYQTILLNQEEDNSTDGFSVSAIVEPTAATAEEATLAASLSHAPGKGNGVRNVEFLIEQGE
jgi:hypothetical protein